MSPSPALPWEVIERAIDHSAHSIKTLYGFTLTCRDLCPRSTMHLYRRVELKDRGELFALCATLQAKPQLQPFVRLVKVPTPEFSPFPLLRMLPNLSKLKFKNRENPHGHRYPPTGHLHRSVLTHCRLFGQNIRTLSLSHMDFYSPSAFSDILLSFPKIQALSCKSVGITGLNSVNKELISQRLSVRLHDFRILTVHRYVEDSVLALLNVAAKYRVTSFSYIADEDDGPSNLMEIFLTSPSDWVQLNSLTWKVLWYTADDFETILLQTIDILEIFHPPKLQEVTVNVNGLSWVDLVNVLPNICVELENVLLVFPRPTVTFSSVHPLNSRLHHSWTSICQRFFPGLAKIGGLKFAAEYSGIAGHDKELEAPIVLSADSRWAATGSEDGTIIIWDIETGCISQEWLTGYATVESLAFSPDSQYIVSTSWSAASRGVGATVWHLHQGVHEGISLTVEEHNDGSSPPTDTIQCAWSPDGACIVSGPQSDGATHIWEATTFQPLHPHGAPWMGELLAFSLNGRWVATAITDDDVSSESWRDLDGKVLPPGECWIWEVESGELHRTLYHGLGPLVKAAAFDPRSSRIATVTGYDHDSIQIWDVATGQQLVIMEVEEAKKAGFSSRLPTNVVVFSGDGRMVLTYNGVEYEMTGAAVWDSFDGAMLAFLPKYSADDSDNIDTHTACFSPCGFYVAFAWHGVVHLWRTSDWSCIAEVSVSEAPVTRIAISPDGQVLCWGNSVGQVFFRRIHDLVSANDD